MNTAWKRTAAPTLSVLDDLEVFDHLRITSSENEPSALRARDGAVAWLESYLQRGLITQTWQYAQDAWTDVMRLPMAAPLQSVSSVQYYDAAGVLTTLSSVVYLTDLMSEPGLVCLAPNQVWPVLQSGRALPVIVTYVVGWAAPSEVPGDIRDGLFLLTGDRYEHREQTVTGITSTAVVDVARMLAGRRVWVPPVPCTELAVSW